MKGLKGFWSNWLYTAAIIAGISIIYACSVNPVTGKKEVSFMSEQQEIALGQKSDPQVVAQFGLYADSTLQQFINEKGQEMAKISHRPNLKYEFKVLDSPVVNAFAVPGGYVYFTRGIMAHFNNEAEFAGVLGHEIGHVTARHGARQQRDQILGQVGLIAGAIFSPAVRGMFQQVAQGVQLAMLSFSRSHESQSDELGVEYSSKIGYDAEHMAEFFKTLKRIGTKHGADQIPTFLSTHPDPGDRYGKVKKMAAEWRANHPDEQYKVNRNEYLRRIDGIMYGDDPKQGYVENDVFYHPELKFKFPIANEWKVNNSPLQLQIIAPSKKAGVILQFAQGQTPQQAATDFIQKNKLQTVDQGSSRINGFPTYITIADASNPQQPQNVTRVLSYFIQDGGNILQFNCIAPKNEFNKYERDFRYIVENYSRLTDRRKINKKPERIHIEEVRRPSTLSFFLSQKGVANGKFEEHATLNNMQLNDKLATGTLVKVIGK